MNYVLESLAAFAAYFAAALTLTAIFILIYIQTTPHNEIKLMREGNGAASLGLVGAVIGFVLPLGTVISVSHEVAEVAIWGAIALLVQIAGHFLARLFVPKLSADIAEGKYAAAIVGAGMAVTLGILQSACWTP